MTPLHADGLWELFAHRCAVDPDAVARWDETFEPSTYAAWQLSVERVAAGLASWGVGAHSRVGWQLPTRAASLDLMLALSSLGAFQLPLLPQYAARELSGLLPLAKVDLLVVATAEQAERARAVDPSLRVELLADVPAQDGGSPVAPSDPDAVRWAFSTSGSTGVPKSALHTDGTLLAATRGWSKGGHADGPDDVLLMPYPIAHVGGPLMLATVLLGGARLALLESPAAITEAFARVPVTMTGGAPAFYQMMLGLQRGSDVPLFPTLRMLRAGGAPLSDADYHRVRTGLRTAVGHDYGMTEAPMVAVADPRDPDDVLAATDGRVVEGNQVRVSAEGELQIRGATVCLGYTDPARDAEVRTDDGWLCTGDLGTVTADGLVTVTGRLKDVIIRKGENVAPLEIEELLITMPVVDEVAVIGLPDDERGELVCAVVRLAPDVTLTLAEITDHLTAAGLMKMKLPERLVAQDSLPMTGLGKIDKAALRRSLGGTA